jgi:hypothetical protein
VVEEDDKGEAKYLLKIMNGTITKYRIRDYATDLFD